MTELDGNEGYRQICTTVPNSLYLRIKAARIPMAKVMRNALIVAVEDVEGIESDDLNYDGFDYGLPVGED